MSLVQSSVASLKVFLFSIPTRADFVPRLLFRAVFFDCSISRKLRELAVALVRKEKRVSFYVFLSSQLRLTCGKCDVAEHF